MEPTTLRLLGDGCIAIGIGLFIGLEREHHETTEQRERAAGEKDSEPPPETLLGVRTFALLSLFGWVAGILAPLHPIVPVAALAVTGGLVVVVALRFHGMGRGLTTEFAALTTFLLGMLVHQERSLAVAFALATTLLLISKPWFKTIIPRMRRMDLTSTLQLAVLLAIVLPLLPVEAKDPWGVLSPRRIGIFVALIAAISYVGYLLNRLLGNRRGAGLTGLVGGLASSTAVTAAMAQQARATTAMILPGQLAVFLASTMMCARVLVVSALIDARVTLALAPSMVVMAAATLGGAFWKWRALGSSSKAGSPEATLELANPFSLLPVIKWGVFFAVILVASALAKQWLGSVGLFLTAAASGLLDVDAINLTATTEARSGAIASSAAALAVMIAVVTNTVVKAGIAWIGGGRAFGGPVAAIFGAAAVAGLGLAALRGL